MAPTTVAGAWAARRPPGPIVLVPAAASGILLVVAVLDLLPDAWEEAVLAGCQWDSSTAARVVEETTLGPRRVPKSLPTR